MDTNKVVIIGGLAALVVVLVVVMNKGNKIQPTQPAPVNLNGVTSPSSPVGTGPVGTNVTYRDPNNINWFLSQVNDQWFAVLPNTVFPPGYTAGASTVT